MPVYAPLYSSGIESLCIHMPYTCRDGQLVSRLTCDLKELWVHEQRAVVGHVQPRREDLEISHT